jgi:hypothetical protein
MTITKNNWFVLALALGLGGSPLGCGDEATIVAPEPPSGAAGSPSGSAGTGGTSGEGSAGTSAGGTAGGSNTACVEEPTTPADFLVRCTDSACRPFDNTSRLGLFRAGEPLPEVP